MMTTRYVGLSVRKLADTRAGTRVKGYHPITGERALVNPETGGAEPWPLLGVIPVGELPDGVIVPTSFVSKAVAEGWATLEDPQMVHAPGGPPEEPWRITHTFTNADAITFKFQDGDVRYRVVHNPGKYDDDSEPSGKRVDWFYLLERD